jgi:hypothetical protein
MYEKAALFILTSKKSNLTKKDQINYSAVSHVLYLVLPKLTEKVVKLRLIEYNNSQFTLTYSMYSIQHNISNTTLLKLLYSLFMIISCKAMTHQQVTRLTLLDLSASFDTTDHAILESFSAWFSNNRLLFPVVNLNF